ncbi:hypothetical protein BJ166DRAFT_234665 [Pestalotiopsis sp. NC0098]|nr:hypothetical protein BJ166DRAFT_234665 [Pestalotiopsis sp. NC0098]
MAMDDATSLASELLNKLSELEQKVETHRQDMACEFQRYSRNLLQNVPGHLSARVEKTIKDSMHKYPALQPAIDLDNPIENESPSKTHMDNGHSNATDNHAQEKPAKPSAPPLLPHKSSAPSSELSNDNAPRSPHEREREFQGLFTPSYLPLLDGRENDKNRLSPAPTLPEALLSSPKESKELTSDSAKDEKIAVGLTVDTTPTTTSTTATRPDPVRNPTEETVSSVASDDSSGKQRRRSALRRSSSSSAKAPSPRRVRFEVEGGEVLPTASPLLSPRVIEHMQSPLSNTTNLLSSSYDSDQPEPAEDGAGLLGSSPPQPKRISSTDKLKAMARNSTEDTSKWSLVGNLQGMNEDEKNLIMGQHRESRPPTSTTAGGGTAEHVERIAGSVEHVETVAADNDGFKAYDDGEEEEEEEEDDELLEMPALTSFKAKKRFSPPQGSVGELNSKKPQEQPASIKTAQAIPINSEPVKSNSSKPQSTTNVRPVAATDDDEMFEWEEDEGDERAGQKKNRDLAQNPSKYLPDVEDEDDKEEGPDNEPEIDTSTLLSTSPAIPISKPAPSEASPPSRHVKEAVGSYNGKPFTISSVKNQSILDKAAKMGNVYSFVGSVDGRSGVDESTSYRPEAVPFNGTPRSFSQRLAMEEFQESRRQGPRNGVSE